MHLVLFAIPILFSILLIREVEWTGRTLEQIFQLEQGTFYARDAGHAYWVRLMQWPLLLAVLGIIIPTPIPLDFLALFAGALMISFGKLWRSRRRLLPPPAPGSS